MATEQTQDTAISILDEARARMAACLQRARNGEMETPDANAYCKELYSELLDGIDGLILREKSFMNRKGREILDKWHRQHPRRPESPLARSLWRLKRARRSWPLPPGPRGCTATLRTPSFTDFMPCEQEKGHDDPHWTSLNGGHEWIGGGHSS